MSEGRWLEVNADMASAVEHFTFGIELFEAGGFEAEHPEGYKARMAFMHAMQSGHTSLESGLVRVLALLREHPVSGVQWHADLIRRVATTLSDRPAILDAELAEAAEETRSFRNVAMRNYDRFKSSRAIPAVQAAGVIVAGLDQAIARFRSVIDPP